MMSQESSGQTSRWLLPIPARIGSKLFKSCKHSKWLVPKADLLHLPDDTNLRARAPLRVATLHMAGPLQRPDLYDPHYNRYVRNWLEKVRRNSQCLITVSEHLRQLVLSEHGFQPAQVVSIPLGIDAVFKPLPTRYGGPPRILYVGWIRAAKNVQAVCEVYKRLASRWPDLELVLLGKQELETSQLLDWMGGRNAASRLKLIPQIPLGSPDLLRVYQHATVLLFPSFAEGWTSPPLEAMASGLPVVCSNCSSLPETVGDAALMASPTDYDGLAECVEQVLGNSSLSRELVERGLNRASKFRWEATANATCEVYCSLVGV